MSNLGNLNSEPHPQLSKYSGTSGSPSNFDSSKNQNDALSQSKQTNTFRTQLDAIQDSNLNIDPDQTTNPATPPVLNTYNAVTLSAPLNLNPVKLRDDTTIANNNQQRSAHKKRQRR